MKHKKRKIYLAGVGMGTPGTITKEVKDAVESSSCIIGAARMLEGYVHLEKEKVNAYRPDEIAAYIGTHQEHQTIAILLSGDAGYYSGAKKLLSVLSQEDYEVQVLPGISAVAYLAAKCQMSWEDASFVSLHGTKQNFIYEVLHHEKTAILLGGQGIAKEVCEKLSAYGLQELVLHIGTHLSYENERIQTKKAAEIQPEDLEGLTVVMIENPHPQEEVAPHIPDAQFLRGEAPMTKEEVRAVCMAKLHLTKNAVLYDVGAGTGSVSIEAALQGGDIQVYAIEKKEVAIALLKANQLKFRADNITIVAGSAPEALVELPAPTHVFIGGSSGNLPEIVRSVKQKNPQVQIVLTAISLETMGEVERLMKSGVLPEEQVTITQLTVAASKTIGTYHMMMGQNPVFVVSCS
ncbi:MAG: precorrin-6y C5,15-methyltransferase (decarboxylating) subunit CbiE [Lachnospiraceae bacterium]